MMIQKSNLIKSALLALSLMVTGCAKTVNLESNICRESLRERRTELKLPVAGDVCIKRKLVCDPSLPIRFQDLRYQHTIYKDMAGFEFGIDHFPKTVYFGGREYNERTMYFVKINFVNK